MQHNDPVRSASSGASSVENGRPLGFYFLFLFLFCLTTFIGWNFGRVPGAVIGFLFATIINTYALQIKLD